MRPASVRLLLAAALLSPALLLGACATRPPADDVEALEEYRQNNDPLEPTNRVLYRVNDAIDTAVLAPVARGYRAVVPGAVRRPIHNVVRNSISPARFVNGVLQGKPRRAGDALMRFLINTTVGVGGLFDVATDWGYPAHETDFGMTLALWGIPEGPFVFLPIFGPSNPRDTVGVAGSILSDPLTWVTFGGSSAVGWTRYGVAALDARERALDPIDEVKRTALDPYATFRSLYRQNRQSEIDRVRADNEATIPAWFPRQ